MQFDAIILAGGAGKKRHTRSENRRNLLTIDGKSTLLYLTIIRALTLSPHRLIIISDKESLTDVKVEVDKVKRSKEYLDLIEKQDIVFVVITEPECKGSAPAVALGAYVLNHPNNHNVTLLMPSDKIIINSNNFFKQAIKSAYTIARKGYMITLGIAPKRPATSYDYIETDNKKSKKWYTIKSFKHRPDAESANAYFKDENYYYNSSILVFKPSDMVAELNKHMPEFSLKMRKVAGYKIADHKFDTVLTEIYSALEPISIENGLFERSKNAAVIPTSLKWIDLSSWSHLVDEGVKHPSEEDSYENVVCLNTQFSAAKSDSTYVKVLGVEGFMVVDTNEALLVCDKENAEDVKALGSMIGESEMSKFV